METAILLIQFFQMLFTDTDTNTDTNEWNELNVFNLFNFYTDTDMQLWILI